MIIEMTGVSKTFGEGHTAVHALRNVDFSGQRGEFVVILGPSGSGKTTLLNLVGTIDDPTSGELRVDGQDLVGMSIDEKIRFRRNSVGFVFQFFNLIPTLTAAENVELVAELTMPDGAQRTASVLQQVGLADRMDHFPAELSGGEQQRVALARALVKEPPILLCDEPTGELDFETGRMILSLLRRINRETNQTVLLVSHNAAIGDIADRVLRIRSGEIVDDSENAHPTEADVLTW
ncbi:MAG: ABC transporter ATP-binding protein [Acidimicrobiia bacterium]|nr:ABC transporter ATP-binding protein [Acidimicrobiia bacterium]